LLFLWPELCIAAAYFSSLNTLQGMPYPDVDLLCGGVCELMELKNIQGQFYRKSQNSELACPLADGGRGKGTDAAA